MKRRMTSVVLAVMTSACLAGTVLTLRALDRMRARATVEEVLYIASPNALKRMSLGYTGLMADLYWTRAVQYFGGKHRHRAMDYRLLAPLLDITTTLDPQLIVAYQFGATFLAQSPPEGAGEPDKAVELVERGIQANPNEWRLYHQLGFLHYMEREDYVAAARAFERGSQVRNANPALKVMAAAMAQHAGERQMARLLWKTVYDSAQESMIRSNAVRHLRALDVDETVEQLEQAVAEFQRSQNRTPQSFMELISAGLLRRMPVDPRGRPYELKNGRVQVQDPDGLPFITKGLPPGREPKSVIPKIPG